MTYKSGMKIKIKVEPTLANPEDALNDMVDDGMSVHDALNNIITESIVESKVNELLEDNRVDDLSDVLTAGEIVDLPNGMVEVELISWDDQVNEETKEKS